MAKAVALIAFALVVLAIAGHVQGYEVKQNADLMQIDGSVSCVTCKGDNKTDWQPLPKARLDMICKSRENGTITLVYPSLTDDTGYYRIDVETWYQKDFCKVHIHSSPDPLCKGQVPGFRSARVRFVNGLPVGKLIRFRSQPTIGFVNKESLSKCRKYPNKRTGKLEPTVYDEIRLP